MHHNELTVATILVKDDIDSLTITDLDQTKAAALVTDLQERLGGKMQACSPDSKELLAALAEADLVVNATPLGMPPLLDVSPLPTGARLKTGVVAFDLVYNPAHTIFIREAQAQGAQAVGGLDMLVRQGASAFKIFTGRTAPYEIMKAAAEKALKPLP